MTYQTKIELIRTKEAEFCKLMKKSFEIAPINREKSDKFNHEALLLKEEILELKETVSSN